MLDERAFKIYSFQEAKGFKGVDVLSRKVRILKFRRET